MTGEISHYSTRPYTVEGISADLRHYIPILARKSRYFARSLDTMKAVLEVFIEAYNKFIRAKLKYLKNKKTGKIPFSLIDFI